MRSLRFLMLFLLIVTYQALSAQNKCYETARAKGIELYNKGELQAAAKKFEAAKFCPDLPANHDLNTWLEKCVITVKLSQSELYFEASDNEEISVEVITKAKSFKVTNAPEWITVTQEGKFIFVNVEDNLVVEPREAKLTITAAGKMAVLDVFQDQADTELKVDPDTLEYTCQNETKMAFVESNVGEWAVKSSPEWVLTERREDTLLLTCEMNGSSDIRTGEVVVEALEEVYQVFISQLPGDTLLKVNKKELVFDQDFRMERIGVTCNMDEWEVESPDRWIDVDRQNDSIKVGVMENQSVFSRHGRLRVKCGTHYSDVTVHQKPHVSTFTMPESELKDIAASGTETIKVTTVPSELKVHIDDTIVMTTPFEFPVDYEHHSVVFGFERHEYLFNEKQPNIEFKPGLRFAAITFTAPKNVGLRTGFIGANHFGAFSHAQVSRPLVNDFPNDTTYKPDGYHFLIGPVYSPIQYAAVYAGIGVGVHQGPTRLGIPNVGLDYEFGVMGLFKNATVSMGFRTTQWGYSNKRTSFVIGLGGYLKRYSDDVLGYCVSDSRRWWSLNYMTRPALNGKGVMFGDLGKSKTRTYLKAMYSDAANDSTQKVVDAIFGFVFTPVNGIIDFCLGAGAGYNLSGTSKLPTVEAEAGFIFNIWRIPLTVMLHESDLISNRHLYVDFGVGFHLGEFKRCSYK